MLDNLFVGMNQLPTKVQDSALLSSNLSKTNHNINLCLRCLKSGHPIS
jgi:hypothetical protein